MVGPRFRPVRLRKRSTNLSAGVEDVVTRELIHVANASMAVRLAQLLSDEAEGKPLPKGEQHVPIRYQLDHGDFPGHGAAVLYVHGLSVRVMAFARNDKTAEHIAHVFNRVDYPVDEPESFLGIARAHNFGDRLGDLPAQSFELPVRETRPAWTRILGVTLWLWLPLISLAVLATFVIAWPWVVSCAAVVVVFTLLLPRLLRQ